MKKEKSLEEYERDIEDAKKRLKEARKKKEEALAKQKSTELTYLNNLANNYVLLYNLSYENAVRKILKICADYVKQDGKWDEFVALKEKQRQAEEEARRKSEERKARAREKRGSANGVEG